MSLGAPLGLLTLVALAPLTAAYFLRRRQRPLTVSALFLWRTPHQKAEAGPNLERYSRELSFLLEVLAVLAATVFLADVHWGRAAEGKHLVVVVDGSMSMSARPPAGGTVAERVRRTVAKGARDDGASALTVVESGLKPRLLAGPRASVSEALAALDAWRPLGAAHEPGPSLLWAKELAGPGQTVRFYTDAVPPAGAAPPPDVAWLALGEALDNVAFVAAQRRDEGSTATVTVRVGSFARAAVKARVSFRAKAADGSGKSVTREDAVELPPGGTAVVRATFQAAGDVEVDLPDDALPEDGHLTLLPSPERTVRVQLLPGLTPRATAALEHFLHVAPGVERVSESSALSFGPPGARADVTVGATGTLHSFVGPFFAEKANDLLEDVDLAGVVWTAGDNPPGRPLVTANDAALVTDDGETVHLNVDFEHSSLARTEAWPVLAGNLVRRARALELGLSRRQVQLGESIPAVTRAGSVFALRGPDGKRPVLGHGAVLLPPAARPGRYVLERNGEPVDALEVLPIDERASDLRARGSATLEPKRTQLAAFSGGGRPLWPLALVLLLALADFALTAPPRPPARERA